MTRTTYKGALPEGWSHLFLDFETYYSGRFGLRHMTYEEYVRDERFQVLCAVALWNGDDNAEGLKAHEVRDYLAKVDWSKTVLVAHNAMFDAFILTEHYGFRPARIVDTMSLARVLYPNLIAPAQGGAHGGYSLNALAKNMLGRPGKNFDVTGAEGLDLAHFEAHPDAYDALLRYCAEDTWLLRDLYRHLLKTERVDKVELSCIDGMIRATTDPVLVLDEALVNAYADEQEARNEEVKHLANDEEFADTLRCLGIEPQTKMGARKVLYCFAKSDPFMQDLIEGDDEAAASLAKDRLLAKSTSEKAKARRFADIAKRGRLPVFVQPNGAHTGRDSGGGSINLQNVKRGSPLRRAVMAPEGHTLIVADSSQIECRVLNWWAGQEWVKDVFRGDGKIYEAAGERLFGVPVSKEGTPELRQYAKIVELGSGYGLGAEGLKKQMRQAGVDKTVEDCGELIDSYRSSHEAVVDLWHRLDRVLVQMSGAPARWTPVVLGDLTFHYGKDSLRLPSGRHLVYPNLRDEDGMRYDRLKRTTGVPWRIYGGAMSENVTQALARDIVFEADARIRRHWEPHGLRLALRVHDELVYAVPKDLATEIYLSVEAEMNLPPDWLPDLVLDTEGDINERWGDAKG